MNAASDGYLGGDTPSDGNKRPKHLSKQEFSKRLRQMLVERQWSQSDLARKAGVTRDAVSTYCRADSFPGEKNLAKIARALNVSPDQLLPNKIERAIDHDTPTMSLKESSTYPGQAWLQINRMVQTKTGLKVMTLLYDDDAGLSDG